VKPQVNPPSNFLATTLVTDANLQSKNFHNDATKERYDAINVIVA
jgi:hypothetical protein